MSSLAPVPLLSLKRFLPLYINSLSLRHSDLVADSKELIEGAS